MANTNYINSNSNNPADKEAMSQWQLLLRQAQQRQQDLVALNAAQNASPQTMVGFALGKLLSNLYGKWQANYDARGKRNRDIKAVSENPNAYVGLGGNIVLDETALSELPEDVLNRIKGGMSNSVSAETPSQASVMGSPANAQEYSFNFNKEKESPYQLLGGAFSSDTAMGQLNEELNKKYGYWGS